MKCRTAVMLCFAAIALSACYEDEIAKVREEFATQMKETRDVVTAVSKDVTTALPGGQYNLLIRDLNGPDKDAKTRAQDFLKSLGHLEDLDTKIEASIWFGFEPAESKSIKVDAFRAPTLSRAEVVRRYTFKAGNLQQVGSTLSLPESDALLRARIDKDLDEIGVWIAAKPTANGWRSSLYPEYQWFTGMSTIGSALPVQSQSIHDSIRKSVIDNLKDAVHAQFEQKLVPIANSDLQPVRWNTLDADQFLFICIRRSDWLLHRKDPGLKVRALIHELDHPERPFMKAEYVDFDLLEFDRNEPVETYPSDKDVVWAVRNMTGKMLDANTLADLQKVKETLAKWQSEVSH